METRSSNNKSEFRWAQLYLIQYYKAEFDHSKGCANTEKALAVAFNTTFRYIDNVSSVNNCYFYSYVDSIYRSELKIKDTTDSENSVSYLDILLEKDVNCNLSTKLYDKCDDLRNEFNKFCINRLIKGKIDRKTTRVDEVFLSILPLKRR